MDLFERISSLRESIPECEQKEMVESIVEIFKAHNITYDQAENVLLLVRTTLGEMSKSLVI